MSRYVLKGKIKSDYIGFNGNKGKLSDIIYANKEAYKVYTEYEKKLRKTLLFNKIYSDDNANTIFCNITKDLFWANDDDELKYCLELSLHDIDNDELVDRWEDYLTYKVLQEFIQELNREVYVKDYDLLQERIDTDD